MEPIKQDWEKGAMPAWYNKQLSFTPEEMDGYLSLLELKPEDIFVDFGCGNGELLRRAAPRVARAVGLDVSREQARAAREAAREFANVEILNSRFQNCLLPDLQFTKGSARKALHHLEEDEKPQFFRRISRNFAPGALFLLEDAVFDFPKAELQTRWPKILQEAAVFYGPRWKGMEEMFENTLCREFAEDFDTWSAALAAGGFKVIKREQKTSFYASLLARKG